MNRFAEIRDVITAAVVAGAAEVIRIKRSGELNASYKDATELVTSADQASDAAIRQILEARVPAIDPSISLVLEESGGAAQPGRREVGADPLDGTNHFACGGTWYAVQGHYLEDGVPLIGVVFQPEVFVPSDEDDGCQGRLSWATRGEGAFTRRSRLSANGFELGPPRPIERKRFPETQRFVACIPQSARMTPEERERVRRILDSGLVAVTTGVGSAGANIMLTIFGGQQVYANFGAGLDLDLIPPQVIAEEAGLTVWGTDRKSPRWLSRKQPVIVAPSPGVAELFLRAAGF